MTNYSSFPKSDTPYIAHLVPFEQLTNEDQESAKAIFSATFLSGHSMKDFLYVCNAKGGILARRVKGN